MSKTSLALVLGFLVVIVGALIISSHGGGLSLSRSDANSSSTLVTPFEAQGTSSTASEDPTNLPVLKPSMPEFKGIVKWWNTPNNEPLTPEQLKGKVVLVDFWTYSCINCIRTQPVLRKWHEMYEKDGLVIVGVHTPEFAFEKDGKNVERAFKQADLRYPIALDSDYGTWEAYENRYWPAEFLFDRQGRMRYTHFGEGKYDVTENAIRTLLNEGGRVSSAPSGMDVTPDFTKIVTAETYFGSNRSSNWDNPGNLTLETIHDFEKRTPALHHWNLSGKWIIYQEYAQTAAAGASFRMRVQADAMHLVLASVNEKPIRVKVLIDGKAPTEEQRTPDMQQNGNDWFITVTDSKLYRIARFPDAKEHFVELQPVEPSGLQFFAATFGEMK